MLTNSSHFFQYAHKLVDLVGEHLHSQPSQELNDKLYFL